MRILILAGMSLILSGAASAEDHVKVGPVPGWVVPVVPPPAVSRGGALEVRLLAIQTHIDESGSHTHLYQLTRVLSSEGLQALGTFTAIWKPDYGDATLNKIAIHRGTTTIDVLGDGKAVTVLHREAELEALQLDGLLTATLQIPDLRVGDELEVAYTFNRQDKALRGYTQELLPLNIFSSTDRLYIRYDWPRGSPFHWQSQRPELQPILAQQKDRAILTIDRPNYTPVKIPERAPGRYVEATIFQLSDFSDWSSVAAVMRPYFEKATQLSADSLLRAEIAHIKAATPDPIARAEMALKLTQGDVRYFLNTQGLGSYIPQDADGVWKARAGDCKGKTALLLALLNELGIEAQPALTSINRVDGADTALPMPGRFDHVFVRAIISGKVYWLDGTRSGDTSLARLAVPPFKWALPLYDKATTLVALKASDPAKPLSDGRLELDARAGYDKPALAKAELILRDDAALNARGFSALNDAQREDALKKYWLGSYDWITPKTTGFVLDQKTGEAHLTMTGTAKMDWSTEGTSRYYEYEADSSRVGRSLTPTRVDSATADIAPIAFSPQYESFHETILLPDNGKNYRLTGDTIDKTVAGIQYTRSQSLKDERFDMAVSTKTSGGEIGYAAAKTADKEAEDLRKKRVLIHLPDAVRAQLAQQEGMTVVTGHKIDPEWEAYQSDINAKKYDAALAKIDAAMAKPGGHNTQRLAMRGYILQQLGRNKEADAAIDEALALDSRNTDAWWNKASSLFEQKRYDDALIAYDKLALLTPEDASVYEYRGIARMEAGKRDEAISDLKIANQKLPGDIAVTVALVKLLISQARKEEALVVAQSSADAAPKNAKMQALLGNVYIVLGRRHDAKIFINKVIELDPNAPDADAYFLRLSNNLEDDENSQLADALKIISIAPERILPVTSLNILSQIPANRLALKAAYEAAMAKHIADKSLISHIEWAYATARLSLGEPDAKMGYIIASKKYATKPFTANDYNNLCWARATVNIDLDKALQYCDTSIALNRNVANLNSRGLVHFRRNEFAAAIDDYNAALILSPKYNSSKYMRGIAKLRAGKTEEGKADIAEAVKVDPMVAERYDDYGIKP